ncbi:MAG: amidohydrolase family protein [Sphingomonadales bacterium]|nr:amidohydrolase family protein [Sphingomonadales bacterium]
MADLELAERPAASTGNWVHGAIVDADAHVEPPYDMWKEYLPAHLRDLAPVLEEGNEHDWVLFEGRRSPLRQLNNTIGTRHTEFKMMVKRSELREVWRPDVRLGDMDADGIDQAVIFGGGPLPTFNNELYMASYTAYQDWLADWCMADRRRLEPVGYVPMRDIDETVGHVQRLAKKGFKVINLPAFPMNPDGWSTSAEAGKLNMGQLAAVAGDPKSRLQYWQPEFDRLWAAIQDADMAITMHLGGRVPRFGDKQHFLPDMPMSKLAMTEPIAILIFANVFARFPKLRLGVIESGVGWMPWFTEYVTRTWEKQRYWTESPLTESPAFFMDRNVYGSFIQDRTGFLSYDLPGGRNIMWSSDYPHSETTFPHSREVIARDAAGCRPEVIADVIRETAKRFFRLD